MLSPSGEKREQLLINDETKSNTKPAPNLRNPKSPKDVFNPTYKILILQIPTTPDFLTGYCRSGRATPVIEVIFL